MVRVYDVPADKLIEALAEHLKKVPELEPPQWAPYVKTGSHAERPPQRSDWWYTRAASILRKVYMQGPVGLRSSSQPTVGARRFHTIPKHHRDAGGSIIRNVMKELEQAELVTKQGNKGRVLTPKGVALLDKISKDIFKELVKEVPSLARYG